MTPILYFDLGSPYAYLAVERAAAVLPQAPELEPVLLGAIFGWRGSGSWARTPARAAGMAEIEDRARRYGLPPVAWPEGWPADGLAAMRAAVWAARQDRLEPFARTVFRRQFAEGADIADLAVLSECADRAGLDGTDLPGSIQTQAIKDDLRARTEHAWKLGVRGIPSLRVGERIFYGDDRLEEAARALSIATG